MDNNRNSGVRILPTIICTFLGIVAIFFAFLTVIDFRNVSDKEKIYTQKVSATADKVEKRTVSHGGGQPGSIDNTTDIYETEFSYIVGKTRYIGRLERETYTVKGTHFAVYVDPDDPSKWVSLDNIERQSERIVTVVLLCLLGLLLMSVGIYFTVHGIKEKKSIRNSEA